MSSREALARSLARRSRGSANMSRKAPSLAARAAGRWVREQEQEEAAGGRASERASEARRRRRARGGSEMWPRRAAPAGQLCARRVADAPACQKLNFKLISSARARGDRQKSERASEQAKCARPLGQPPGGPLAWLGRAHRATIRVWASGRAGGQTDRRVGVACSSGLGIYHPRALARVLLLFRRLCFNLDLRASCSR